MRLLRTVVFVFALTVLLVPGCSPAEVVCDPADLVAPQLSAPADHARIADNTPWLTWEMRAGGQVACHPDKYRVSIRAAPAFTHELGSEVPAMEVTGGATSPDLQEGKTYRWNVTAIRGHVSGPISETRTFSIGSDCTQDELLAPVLLEPADNSIVHTSRPTFKWTMETTCIPQGYYLWWKTEASHPICWSDGVHGGEVYVLDASGRLDDLGTDLEDCREYDWAVSPLYGCTDPSDAQTCKHGSDAGSAWGDFSVQLPGTTSCPDDAPYVGPSDCAWPTPTPTATVYHAPLGEKPWEVTANANCRVCPSGACNESGFAPKGYLAPIEGRNEDATWFRIKAPGGVSCWVWGGALKVPADAGNLGLLAYPTSPAIEEPAPVQVHCSSFKDIRTCNGNPPCTWDRAKRACVRP